MDVSPSTVAVVGAITLLLYVWVFRSTNKSKLTHIRGPKQVPFFGNALQMPALTPRLKTHTWAKEFGPVFKVKILADEYVILADYEHIYEMLVKQTNNFAGRPDNFRFNYLLENTGMNQMEPDASWRFHRKLGQRSIKQFGDGLRRIEEVNTNLARDMIDIFSATNKQPFDPMDTIVELTLKSITTFVIGKQVETSEPLFQLFRDYKDASFRVSSPMALLYVILDFFPFLIHFPLSSSRDLWHTTDLKAQAWAEIRRHVREDEANSSFAKHLIDTVDGKEEAGEETSAADRGRCLTDLDARMICMTMVTGGHATTATSFHALINILAHHPDVQDKIYQETAAVARAEDAMIQLGDKKDLPYTQATIQELLRYLTISPAGLPRRAIKDATIQGVWIPKDTSLMPSFWALHHDADFWGDPDVFRPERFLDADGQLVPADHDNRKHVMAFSAGVRGCPGEQFALNRLFLWTTNITRRFQILPAPGNIKASVHPTAFVEDTLVVRLENYKVCFHGRFITSV